MTAHDIALATRAHRVAKEVEHHLRMIAPPVDVTNEARFPNIAEASRYAASLPDAARGDWS